VDGLGELQDLVGELQQLFVCCSSCWTVCHWWSARNLAFLVGPLVDPGLEVVRLGGDIGLHLGPLAAGTGRGLTDLLPGVLGGQVNVHLGLVDTLAELVTGLRHSRLGRGLGVGGALLEVVELG
jgi:hypothetical protein